MAVLRRVGKTPESCAITAGQVVRSGRGGVMPMGDVRYRIERKSEQQSSEGYSQPLRRSSGE
jgi:hypothetical protein